MYIPAQTPEEINEIMCNHQTDSPFYLWPDVWLVSLHKTSTKLKLYYIFFITHSSFIAFFQKKVIFKLTIHFHLIFYVRRNCSILSGSISCVINFLSLLSHLHSVRCEHSRLDPLFLHPISCSINCCLTRAYFSYIIEVSCSVLTW